MRKGEGGSIQLKTWNNFQTLHNIIGSHTHTQEWTRSAYPLSPEEGRHCRTLVDQAVQVASTARGALGPPTSFPSGVLQSRLRLAEAEADALLLAAQMAVMQQRWQEGEAALGEALSALGSVSRDDHPRLALPLTLLAWVYSRTARVTLAEGLFREAGKLLQLDPQRGALPADWQLAHPSAAALLAWRHAQLLTALPRRGAEAERWHDLAGDLARRGGVPAPLLDVLGPLDLLKGTAKGVAFPGMLLSVPSRRAFPIGL